MPSQVGTPAGPDEGPTIALKRFREVSTKQMQAMFELADILKKLSKNKENGVALLRSIGVADEQFTILSNLAKFDAKSRTLIEDKGIALPVVLALLETTERARQKSIRYLGRTGKLSLSDIAKFETNDRNRTTPIAATYGQLKDAVALVFDRQATDRRVELETRAKSLYATMLDYDALSLDIKALRKLEISRSAAEVKACFKSIFENVTRPVEKWLAVGRENRLARALAEAEHALVELSAGNFSETLPNLDPRRFRFLLPGTLHLFPRWSALDSVGFLTGEQSLQNERAAISNFRGRRLTAISLNGGIGGQALGVACANYELLAVFEADQMCVETIRKNVPYCNIAELDFRSDPGAVVQEIDKLLQTDGDRRQLDVLSAAFIRSEHEADGNLSWHDECYDAASKIVAEIRPRAFFLEANERLKAGRKARFVSDYRKLGYQVQFYVPNYGEFGLPQRSSSKERFDPGRVYIIGIEVEAAQSLRLPVADPSQQRRTIAELIDHAAFPDRTWHSNFKLKRQGPIRRAAARAKYDARTRAILGHKRMMDEPTRLQEATTVPDVSHRLNHYEKKTEPAPATQARKVGRPAKYVTKDTLSISWPVQLRWAAVGFDVNLRLTDEQLQSAIFSGDVLVDGKADQKQPVFDSGLLPLTPAILKAIQGIPLYWKMAGNLTQQIERLCEASPPIIALAISHSLHAALTGHSLEVDVIKEWSTHTFRPSGRGPVPRIENEDDGEAWVAKLWERGVLSMNGDEPPVPAWPHPGADDDEGEVVDYFIDNGFTDFQDAEYNEVGT